MLLFADEVHRVIPASANHSDSPRIREIADAMPGCLQTISPTPDDTWFDDLNFGRLEKAFKQIKGEDGRFPPKELGLIFDQSGHVRVKGNVWLSNAKLEDRVRELLMKHDLAVDLSPFLGSAPSGDSLSANREVADLIVSYVADRIARRTGLDTMTDQPLAFTVHALDALEVSELSRAREAEGALASAVARVVVPAEIESLSLSEYLGVRTSYSALRATFQDLIRLLSERAKLPRQQSGTAVEAKLERSVHEFEEEWRRYKAGAFGRRLKRWTPFSIGGLLTVSAALASPWLAAVLAGGTLAVDIVERGIGMRDQQGTDEKAFHMLCRLERDILRKAKVRPLV